MSKIIISSMLHVHLASAIFSAQSHRPEAVQIPDQMPAKRTRNGIASPAQCVASACYRSELKTWVFDQLAARSKMPHNPGTVPNLEVIASQQGSGILQSQVGKFAHNYGQCKAHSVFDCAKMTVLEANLFHKNIVSFKEFDARKNQLKELAKQNYGESKEWGPAEEEILTTLNREMLTKDSSPPSPLSAPNSNGSSDFVPNSAGSADTFGSTNSNRLDVNQQLNLQVQELQRQLRNKDFALATAWQQKETADKQADFVRKHFKCQQENEEKLKQQAAELAAIRAQLQAQEEQTTTLQVEHAKLNKSHAGLQLQFRTQSQSLDRKRKREGAISKVVQEHGFEVKMMDDLSRHIATAFTNASEVSQQHISLKKVNEELMQANAELREQQENQVFDDLGVAFGADFEAEQKLAEAEGRVEALRQAKEQLKADLEQKHARELAQSKKNFGQAKQQFQEQFSKQQSQQTQALQSQLADARQLSQQAQQRAQKFEKMAKQSAIYQLAAGLAPKTTAVSPQTVESISQLMFNNIRQSIKALPEQKDRKAQVRKAQRQFHPDNRGAWAQHPAIVEALSRKVNAFAEQIQSS